MAIIEASRAYLLPDGLDKDAFITRVLDPHPPATSVGGCGGDSSVVSLKSAPIMETRSEGSLWKARSQALSIL
jgi:hypothetical protein